MINRIGAIASLIVSLFLASLSLRTSNLLNDGH